MSTIFVAKAHIGGVYVVTAWYVGVWAASVVGIIQLLVGGHHDEAKKGKKKARRSSSASSSSSSSSSDSEEEGHRRQANTSERTPLLAGGRPSNGSAKSKGQKHDEGGAIGWWLVQVLLSVPVFVMLVGQIALMLLDSMSQGLADGSSAATGKHVLLHDAYSC